jgi:hypothetical protein
MVVSQEWAPRFLNYVRFMGMLWACTASDNDDALLLLGLVKPLCFSLFNTAIYLMLVFGGRKSFTNWFQERRGSNTYCRQWTMDTMKWRTSLGSSLSSTTTHRWKPRKPCYTSSSSVRWKIVIMLKRYEELGWGRQLFIVQDLP